MGSRAWRRAGWAWAVAVVLAGTVGLAQQQDLRECELTITGQIPLPSGAGRFYRRVGLVPEYAATPAGPEWRSVGLYGHGLTTRPDTHEQAGIALAQQIVPIDGRIVMVSIGMSNTSQEFRRFETRAESDPIVNAELAIVDGAQGGRPADVWTLPTAETWDNLDARLAQNGLTPDQVQIAWMKHAVRSPMHPPLDFPEHPETLATILEQVVTSLKTRYPNVSLLYLSSRTRAYNTNQSAQSPEPHAYEGGFAVQWLIERQIDGDPALRFDGLQPPAPWMSWGPYLWTDGMGAAHDVEPQPFEARSDGMVWTCADVSRDGVHPSPPTPGPGQAYGEFKVGDQLMAFFKTDATTTPWFLETTSGGPAILALTANGADVSGGGRISGDAPFPVSMSAVTSQDALEHTWTYGDGTFSYNEDGDSPDTPFFDDDASPVKVFKTPGTYDVRLTVSGQNGATTLASFEVVARGTVHCQGEASLSLARGPAPGVAELRWCLEPTADAYHVYRATSADGIGLACFQSGITTTSAIDDGASSPSGLFVYLVTFVIDGNESTLGHASNGNERVATQPCP